MPRLEEGRIPSSATKFKKRRAWITQEEDLINKPTLPINESTSFNNPSKEAKVKHDYNKTVTRIEHDYNKNITRPEHETQPINTVLATRVEHDYNKSVTKVEHENNKTVTDFNINNFFAFMIQKRLAIVDYDEELSFLLINLSDVHKQIFWHVAIECIMRNSLRTGPIEIKSFFAKLDISIGVVRTTLNRLVEKKLLLREKGKLGKNGFAIIALPKKIFNIAKELFNEFKNLQAGNL